MKTPECDAFLVEGGNYSYAGLATLARSLETRLRSAEERIKQLQAIAGHLHVAMYVDGKLIDECRQCGLDLRDPVHWR